MKTGDAEAVDPSSEAAFDRGVPDVIIYANRIRIEILEDNVQVPDGGSYQPDTGVGVVHSRHFVTRVERREFRHTRLELLELFGDRAIGIVFESTPAVVADFQLGHGPEDVLRIGALDVDNVGGEHRDFQVMLANNRDQPGKVLPHAVRLDVASLSHGEID